MRRALILLMAILFLVPCGPALAAQAERVPDSGGSPCRMELARVRKSIASTERDIQALEVRLDQAITDNDRNAIQQLRRRIRQSENELRRLGHREAVLEDRC